MDATVLQVLEREMRYCLNQKQDLSGAVWLSPELHPPHGKNTKSNRQVLEAMLSMMFIDCFRAHPIPKFVLAFLPNGYYRILFVPNHLENLPRAVLAQSRLECTPVCTSVQTPSHGGAGASLDPAVTASSPL